MFRNNRVYDFLWLLFLIFFIKEIIKMYIIIFFYLIFLLLRFYRSVGERQPKRVSWYIIIIIFFFMKKNKTTQFSCRRRRIIVWMHLTEKSFEHKKKWLLEHFCKKIYNQNHPTDHCEAYNEYTIWNNKCAIVSMFNPSFGCSLLIIVWNY